MKKRVVPISSRQAGLGLVEIMIALAIGAVMLAGVLGLVAWVSKARTELDKTSEQIENGRYAIQLLSDELRLAGFYGNSQIVASGYAVPTPCTTTVSDLGFSASGINPVPVLGYTSPPSGASCLSYALTDSEVLSVRHAETSSIAAASAVSGAPYIQLSQCEGETPAMLFGAGGSTFELRDKNCSAVTELWPYSLRTYYLSDCDICSASDGIPTLKVAELQSSSGGLNIVAQSVAEGIEDIHFEYGMDLDADGAPDCYVPDPSVDTAPTWANCPSGWESEDATNWSNVVSVRINLLARSTVSSAGWTDEHEYDLGRKDADGLSVLEGPFGDSYRRQVYSTVVTLPNVSGVREE